MWTDDLTNSAHDFMRVVWPAIGPCIGGGELQPVEAVTATGFAKDLDVIAGIDAWQTIREQNCIRGIASRVQYGCSWDTFTIRMSRDSGNTTEYHKRITALDNLDAGYLFPHMTIQAYIADPPKEGRLISVCAVETRALYTLARELVETKVYANAPYWGHRRPAVGGATFLYIRWDYIEHRLPGALVTVTPEAPALLDSA